MLIAYADIMWCVDIWICAASEVESEFVSVYAMIFKILSRY